MPNYQNGKIYILKSKIGNMRYYGSTVRTLKQRLNEHKTNKKRYENGKTTSYKTSYQILDYDDYEISLVEDFSCSSKQELETRERWFIENNECVNKYIPTRSKKEYYKEHEKELKEKKKKYYDDHKQEINERNKKYYKEHEKEIKEYNKEYRQRNKQELSQQKKLYREKNKDKIKEKQKIKITCVCGAELTKRHIRRHERSKKHQQFLEIYNFIYS